MIVVAFRPPLRLVPDWIRPKARARCSGFIALIGKPLRSRGMKCQLSRSGESKVNVACSRCESSSAASQRWAAVPIARPLVSIWAPAQTARPTTARAARVRLGLIFGMAPPPPEYSLPIARFAPRRGYGRLPKRWSTSYRPRGESQEASVLTGGSRGPKIETVVTFPDPGRSPPADAHESVAAVPTAPRFR